MINKDQHLRPLIFQDFSFVILYHCYHLQNRWRRSGILPSKATVLRTSFLYEVLALFTIRQATAYVLYLWGGNEAQDHVKLSRASSKRTAITNSTSQSERSEASWQARDPCPAALCNVAAVSGGPFACPIESPDPTLNWEFPVPIFPDFYPPAERLDETECGQFDSFCLHETLSVAGLPHALGEALSSSLDSLSRSARHAAAFPGFAAYPQSLPSYRRRVHGYDGFKR